MDKKGIFFVGAFLCFAGVILVAVQMLRSSEPVVKGLDLDWTHVILQTNVAGFGVILAGVILLLLPQVLSKRSRPPKNQN
jgi:hypothetical protein